MDRTIRKTVCTVSIGVLLAVAASPLTAAATAVGSQLEPPTNTSTASEPWVVSLGDSYMSGEGGRWAGNDASKNIFPGALKNIDALGKTAYWDTVTGESAPTCHRSQAAPIHIGGAAPGPRSLNLACSGATTGSKNWHKTWKPGIDFAAGPTPAQDGQALQLQQFATTHRVTMVTLSIGGNDLGFANIVGACVRAYLNPLPGATCTTSDAYVNATSTDTKARVRDAATRAILNIQTAMRNAGRPDNDWTLLLQLVPNPLPSLESAVPNQGLSRYRENGCPLTDDVFTTVMPVLAASTMNAAALQVHFESHGLTNVLSGTG